ncbi:potassium-transporting ATPase subunit F [Caulobacter sp. CCUG 60055]|nr:potassium-transporting ATPase subunit F [Caulobacter sp. CCUG 60055]MBQ1543174.1 potassium-transporting ATPase subunit F [Caulobacteraceae bacterium]
MTVIVALIYAAAAVGIGIYMIAALLRPDRF